MSELLYKPGMKPLEWVRLFMPCEDEKEADRILWGATCFPFGPFEMVEDHLREFAVDKDWARIERKQDEAMENRERTGEDE